MYQQLELAESKGVYDELHCGDIVEFMDTKIDDASVDAVLSADVFIYIGDIADVLKSCARVLKPGGRLSFTVEALEDGGKVWLLPCGRFGHSSSYIHELAARCGFEVQVERSVDALRHQGGVPVKGGLFVLRKA